MAKRISATHAAKKLREVLNEVELNGETFEVERHGKLIAEIRPAAEVLGQGSLLTPGEDGLIHGPEPSPELARVIEQARRERTEIPPPRGERFRSLGELLEWLRANPFDPEFAKDVMEARRIDAQFPDEDPWERSSKPPTS